MSRIQTGEKLPDFRVDTQDQNHITLYSLLKGKTVLRVLRYIGCPSCRVDVHEIAVRYEEFTKRGAQVLVVMQSTQKNLNDALAGEKLPLSIVCDPGMAIYQALAIPAAKDKEELRGPDAEAMLAIRDRVQALGYAHGVYEGDELQLPAMFIADEDGTVLYAHYGTSIPDMPSVDQMLAILDGLD